MLLVKTFLAQSLIDGFGLFAGEHIHAGTVIWNFDPRVDIVLEATQIEKLSPAFKEYCEKYGYLDARVRKYVICGDDSRFVNHPPRQIWSASIRSEESMASTSLFARSGRAKNSPAITARSMPISATS